MIRFVIASACILATSVSAAQADTLNVPGTYATIQAAIDAATDGDVVLIADGTFFGSGNKNLNFAGKNITVRSENGAANCIIHCDYSGQGFLFENGEDATAVVDGVTVRGASTYRGGGIACYSDSRPTIRNCRFVDGYATYGGGVYLSTGCNATILDCTLSENRATYGGGIYCRAREAQIQGCKLCANGANHGAGLYCYNAEDTLVVRCDFSQNHAYSRGGAAYIGTEPVSITDCIFRGNSASDGGALRVEQARLSNCIFSENDATRGGAIYGSYGTTITNCTFVANAAETQGGAICWSGYYPYPTSLTNCILWDNTPNPVYLSCVPFVVSFCDIEGGQAAIDLENDATLDWGAGNIDIDPGFALQEDHHLMMGSPCIDTGTNTPGGDPTALPSTDLDGNPRPLDGNGDTVAIADMGTYEFDPTAPTIAISSTTIDFDDTYAGGSTPWDEPLQVRNAGGGTLAWTITEDCPWLTIEPLSGTSAGEIDEVTLHADVAGLTEGSYSCEVIVSDPAAANNPRTISVDLQVAPTRRVPSQYATIQGAIDAAEEGDIVLVADGTYTGEGNKLLDLYGKAITVCSENGPANCIIDCEGDGRAFYMHSKEGPEAAVIGLTILNGVSTNGGGFFCSSSNPTVRNCILRNCRATYAGGGVFCSGSNVSFTNCAIIDCAATVYGGGVYCYSSSPTLANCTITGSLADRGSGAYCFDSSPTITNTLIWGGDDQALYVSSGTPTVTCCNIQGGWPGATNLDANPMLAGDGLHLTGGSPCMDAGDPAAFYSGQTDLDGQPRRLYAAADIGADEFAWTADFDLDADVDLADFSLFQSCFNGPNRPPASAGCDAVDFDADSDVDVADFGVFGACFNGPNRRPRCL